MHILNLLSVFLGAVSWEHFVFVRGESPLLALSVPSRQNHSWMRSWRLPFQNDDNRVVCSSQRHQQRRKCQLQMEQMFLLRGGDASNEDTISLSSDSADTPTTFSTSATGTATDPSNAVVEERELSLDEKVHAAMRKLGLQLPLPELDGSEPDRQPPSTIASVSPPFATEETAGECENGVCAVEPSKEDSIDPKELGAIEGQTSTSTSKYIPVLENVDEPQVIADRIAQTMNVDISLVWAALGATSTTAMAPDLEGPNGSHTSTRTYNERAAKDMIQMELDMIAQIEEDSQDVKNLVQEGYDTFMVRRALAFTERNVDDARAILLADKMDEEEENAKVQAEEQMHAQEQLSAQKKVSESSFKTVNVAADFDPAKLGSSEDAQSNPTADLGLPSRPTAIAREDVIFEATSAQVQELVFESPIPVLLDIYADWCGPCKALSPILEEMAMKGGGAFRLVKVNSDNERAISQALQVTALPTIFGLRNGKILNMFQGMPKSQEMMKSFLMGLLIPGQSFSPPVSAKETQEYADISAKLLKVAGSAGFSFSARERLQDRVAARLDELVEQTGDVFDAEQSATTIRSLLSNIIREPYESKFRSINLSNAVVASKIGKYPACLAMLQGIGFAADGPTKLTIGRGKNVINVAPVHTTREAIDKWIDRTRYEVARASRRRRDEADRVRIQAELATAKEVAEANAVPMPVETVDPNKCTLKLRLDGKKTVYNVVLQANDPLGIVLEKLPSISDSDGEFQITCVAKRLVVKSTDSVAMNRTLQDHGLMPNAAIVVRSLEATDDNNAESTAASKLANRVATKKKNKKGTHTMQSIGIYSKDDNAKGELVDGGGGTLYEQDVTDDEADDSVA